MQNDSEMADTLEQTSGGGSGQQQEGVGSGGPGSGGRKDFAGTVRHIAGELREEAVSVANERRTAFAGRIDDMSEAVRRSGAELRQQQPWLADIIDRGASQLGMLAGHLRDNDVATAVDELKRFADRQPALFAGTALLAGFALGRMIQIAMGGSKDATLEGSYG